MDSPLSPDLDNIHGGYTSSRNNVRMFGDQHPAGIVTKEERTV